MEGSRFYDILCRVFQSIIYNIKDKNVSGGVLVFALTGLMIFLMGVNLYENI